MESETTSLIKDILSESSDDDSDNLYISAHEGQQDLKEVKTYYLFYRGFDKKFNICISNGKPKEYFACIMCDEDKDFIMEFENYFKYNVDYIKTPINLRYSIYRAHNLTKDKLKQAMDIFVHGLGQGYYLDYFSTVKHW